MRKRITEQDVRDTLSSFNSLLRESAHEVRFVRKQGLYALESKRKDTGAIHGVGDICQGTKRDCYRTLWAMITAIALFQN